MNSYFHERLKDNAFFGIYTIFDSLAKTFSPIFIQKNHATASRMFKSMKTNDNFAFDDQHLICLGAFNIKNGEIIIKFDGDEKLHVGLKELLLKGGEIYSPVHKREETNEPV